MDNGGGRRGGGGQVTVGGDAGGDQETGDEEGGRWESDDHDCWYLADRKQERASSPPRERGVQQSAYKLKEHRQAVVHFL